MVMARKGEEMEGWLHYCQWERRES